MKFAAIVGLAAVAQCTAFHFGQMEARRNAIQLKALASEGDSRRDFFSKTGAASLFIASSVGLGFGVMAPPANAVSGVGKVSERLKA